MNNYNVSDYGIFNNAISTTKTVNDKIATADTLVKEVEQKLSDQAIFMGPIQEQCISAISTAKTKLSNLSSNFTTISNYLAQTSSNYQAGDQEASTVITTSTDGNVITADSAAVVASGTMKNYQFNGKNYNIVNTKTDVATYQDYIQKNGIYQNTGFLDGQCMILSQYYAKDLLTGKYTSKSAMADKTGAPAVAINERTVSTNEQDVLNYVYSELNEGHPVVLQVSQRDPHGRHLVTAVGYDSSVSSSNDLNPNNILVLDCVDGKIQTLGQSREQGGHARRLFASSGNYQALGPTEKFLNQIA